MKQEKRISLSVSVSVSVCVSLSLSGYSGLPLRLWERLFTCISSPHSSIKRIPDYRQSARVTHHL